MLTYGLLTAGAIALSFALRIAVIVVWLAGHAVLGALIARTMLVKPWARKPLYAGAALDAGIALLVVALGPITVFQLLFVGAAYAMLFGVWQIVMGVALRDSILHSPRAQHHRPERAHSVLHT